MLGRREVITFGAAALALAGTAARARTAEDPALRAAIAGAWRGAANVARDGARHPYESLLFWGLRPGQTVIEVVPGGGYWTEILAPYAMATGGQYIAGVADLDNPDLSAGARKGREAFESKFGDAEVYGDIHYVGFGPVSPQLGPFNSADLVITSRNVHNFLWTEGLLDKVMEDFVEVLKPGGMLGVEDHRADPRPQVPDGKDGYVAVATVVAAAEKAGFVLDGQSEINANPKDTKDHPFGVWTLPPVRRSAQPPLPGNPLFDHSRYDAIGESDRMTLRFVKPK
jgi:predicted methyltransferase